MKKENKAKGKSDLHVPGKADVNAKILLNFNNGIGGFYEFIMSKDTCES